MLQIQDIKKQYVTGELVQTALDGVSLTFRDSEFVAILGPSGSGKTTLLNVIGGLDRYDSGDLVINGISTKKYSDRDWDSYRNHTIGFVFQSYNLIPHQSVLSNVELALTISGISRSERRKRAIRALENVGLGNQLHKRPNQMSGGQMQRVAIARALVNNPDILLADEPTGALDSETSVQVMELLKEVSKDRLVVMVTHNPELAEDYASRIVRVRDGRIVDDSNPYWVDNALEETPRHKSMRKVSMSFLTALSLSFNNLRTKKGRTILTAFAGSIGIIGISLILSLSTGFQKYIDKIQEDTLSNYPLSIQSETADMTSMMMIFGSALTSGGAAEDGTVLEQPIISQMFAQVGSNDLSSFKAYLDANYDQVASSINDIQYSYSVRPRIYSADAEKALQVNPSNLLGTLMGNTSFSSFMDTNVFYEMIDNYDLLESQYDVLRGRWPENANELIVVLSSPGQIADYMAYTIGLKDTTDLQAIIDKVMSGEEAESADVPMRWSYDELMALEFSLVPVSSTYRLNEEYQVWEDMSADLEYMKALIAEGQRLKVVGIVCPKEGVSATTLSAGIAYTKELTQTVISEAKKSEIVVSQLADMQKDVFTGKAFSEQDSKSEMNFDNMISIDEEMLSSAFGMNLDTGSFIALFKNYFQNVLNSINIDTTAAQNDFISEFSTMAADMMTGYVTEHLDEQTGKAAVYLSDAQQIVDNYLSSNKAHDIIAGLERKYMLDDDTLNPVYRSLLLAQVSYCVTTNLLLPENSASDAMNKQTPVTQHEQTFPDEEVQQPNEPEIQQPTIEIPTVAYLTVEEATACVAAFSDNQMIHSAADAIAIKMMEPTIRQILSQKMSGFGTVIMNQMANAFYIDEEMLADAFQFNMNEEDLRRLMEAMTGSQTQRSAAENLRDLGYADLANPTAISVYFVDFSGKETFLDFLDSYNEQMQQQGSEDQVISYTDLTGTMMSSVRTIIDSVSYVLIAFVAVSLVVSSIMIGIITYISVMERTKEIGVLRALGASKRNISQVFNAETFIIGFCSGLIGICSTIALNIPINAIILALTNNPNIQSQLPPVSAVVLISLSMVLTMIGGLIPSRQAAKKDPVIALRSE